MKTVYLALARALLVARARGGAWRAETRLEGLQPTCLAADRSRPGGSTAGHGDAGCG